MGDVATLQPGAFVGRDAEVSTAVRLLSSTRLLTLTGPPGVGKTRLATEVARLVADDFADGTVFVDLSAARDAVTALNELARHVGNEPAPNHDPRGVVHDWLGDRQLLLLLDNAEQVTGLAEEIPGLLDHGHDIRILVTSRESLHLGAERTISIPPLEMPAGLLAPGEPVDLPTLHATAAVQMFAAEARGVQPDFAVTPDNAAAVAEVCVRVDGLPLAIKLAAVRVQLLGPGEIADRLREHRALLESRQRDVPPRHRTLHGAIAWSYDLLGDEEQTVFRRLSVFSAPCTFAAAEAVLGLDDSVDLLEVFDSLIGKSLVQPVPADPHTRFAMLESIKEYAAEQLAEDGERDAVRDRHLRYFSEISAVSEAVIGTASESHWWEPMAHLERDVRRAVDWGYQVEDGDAVAMMAAALGWHRYLRGHVGTGSGTVERALQQTPAARRPVSDASMTALLAIGGILAWARSDLDRAAELLPRSAAVAQGIGDLRHEAIATAFMGHVARDRGLLDVARVHHQRAGRLFDDLDNARGSAWAKFDLGRTEWQAGDLDLAATLFRDALTAFRRIDYHWAAAWTAWALGSVRLAQHDLVNGVALTLDSMETFERVFDRRGVANCLESLAVTADEHHLQVECLQLLSAADQLRTRLLAPLTELETTRIADAERSSADFLGEYAAEQARDDGRSMSTPAVIAMARTVGGRLERGDDEPADGNEAVVLTPREHDVAALVARGCTNQQIGSSLGIAARTAEVHVRNIMGKLDVRSRSEIAVWMVTHR